MTVIQELIGLFVDDGALAIAILGVVAFAALVAAAVPGMPLAAGAILVLGCPGVLLINILRASRS
ncbi:MAG TPA: hypothetical protein VII14_02640 [Xanthobacteraceae bacterium]|jgi:hypothetical protein